MTPGLRTRLQGGVITTFDPVSGDKFRFGMPGSVPLTKSAVPELADVRLTNACSIGCAYCYQGSTPHEPHGRPEDITRIARALGAAGVFEAALGGGEVTEYPGFIAALQDFHSAGVVANFTTRAPGWIAERWSELAPFTGGFAVSIGSAREVERLAAALRGLPLRAGQVNLHVVMGTVRRDTLERISRSAAHHGYRMTLLGYKTTGRGGDFPRMDDAWWVELLPQWRALGVDVSIDTALAAAHHRAILDAGVPQMMFHLEEGKFSVYIDAVTMTMSRSSYEHAERVPWTEATWLEAYRRY